MRYKKTTLAVIAHLLLLIAGQGQAALTDNLVHYWKLDESSGNAADAVGALTLTNTNTVTYAAAKINNGAVLTAGSSNYLTGSMTQSTTLAGFSLSFWANRSSNSNYIIVGKDDSENVAGVWIHSDGNVYFRVENSNTVFQSATDGTTGWHHYVLTYDGTQGTPANRIVGYRDGSSLTLSTIGDDPPATTNATKPFTIGSNEATDFSTGTVDEVGVWTRALSGAEVTSLYNGGSGLAYPFSGGGSATGGAAHYYRQQSNARQRDYQKFLAAIGQPCWSLSP